MPDRHRTLAQGKGAFVCPVCGNVYATQFGLNTHFSAQAIHGYAADRLLRSIRNTGFWLCDVCKQAERFLDVRPVYDEQHGWIHPTCKEETAYAQVAQK